MRLRPPSGAPGGRERGQATVELALVLPLLLVLVLLAVQVGLVVRDQVLLVHATREAARAAAVGGATEPVPAPGGLDPARLELDVGGDGRDVWAVGRYRTPVLVPLLSRLQGEVVLRSQLTMRREEE